MNRWSSYQLRSPSTHGVEKCVDFSDRGVPEVVATVDGVSGLRVWGMRFPFRFRFSCLVAISRVAPWVLVSIHGSCGREQCWWEIPWLTCGST